MPQKQALVVTAVAVAFYLSFRSTPLLAAFPRLLFWNTIVVYTLLWFVRFFWTTLVYPFYFSPLRNLPQPRDAHFLFGSFRDILKKPSGEPQRDWIDDIPNDGVIYYRWLFNEPRILVTNPKALAEVLVQRNYEFIKPLRLRTGLGRLLGVGILLAEGDEHKRQRRALMPAFSFRHIKDLYPVFWRKSQEMIQTMLTSTTSDPDRASVVEIRDWASRATLDIIGVAGMGQDFNALADPSSELNRTYKTIFSPSRGARMLQLIGALLGEKFIRVLPIKRNEEMKDAISTIKRVAADLIRDKRAALEKGAQTDVDILSVAIRSGNFTDDDLVNQLMTFLAAGHETTASAVTWAVYLLCKHPDVQTRLREELRTANLSPIPSSDEVEEEQVNSQIIDSLPYLSAVIHETLRLYPPVLEPVVPLTMRTTTDQTTIQNHVIPANSTVIICPWAINTSKHLWGEDARTFNPGRWLAPGCANTGGAESNYAVTTFLHGPRSCIGKVGAFEMKLAEPEKEVEIQGGITANPKGGLRIRIRPVEG